MYKRILVPVDGSVTANRGLREALRLARGQKVQLCLLHVVEEFFIGEAGEAVVFAEDVFTALRASGKRTLARAEALVRKEGLRPRSVLIETMARPVADLVVREARKWKADLIVIGTHGRRGMRRVVMGSDAEQVVRTSPVPVLLVRATARG
jgi:nucleotide-binding universal stress UspA family protein